MTTLLEEALSELAKLPPAEQDALAAILMNELASEKRLAESFSQSQDSLANLPGRRWLRTGTGTQGRADPGAAAYYQPGGLWMLVPGIGSGNWQAASTV
jgi:hypothetical protein